MIKRDGLNGLSKELTRRHLVKSQLRIVSNARLIERLSGFIINERKTAVLGLINAVNKPGYGNPFNLNQKFILDLKNIFEVVLMLRVEPAQNPLAFLIKPSLLGRRLVSLAEPALFVGGDEFFNAGKRPLFVGQKIFKTGMNAFSKRKKGPGALGDFVDITEFPFLRAGSVERNGRVGKSPPLVPGFFHGG